MPQPSDPVRLSEFSGRRLRASSPILRFATPACAPGGYVPPARATSAQGGGRRGGRFFCHNESYMTHKSIYCASYDTLSPCNFAAQGRCLVLGFVALRFRRSV